MVRVIQTLLTWYSENHREMPWRETNDPYKIWISEIILQQTRVQQGLPYYLKFTDKFKTVNDLALASEDDVLKCWQGLGYYSRARNLHKAAKYIHTHCDGKFPSTFNEILNLPGVGDYTASAISAFAFNQNQIAVDGNVKRLASRWFGIDLAIDKPAFIQQAKHVLFELLNISERADTFNQAIIELGATVCIPVNPKCEDCPVRETCVAFIQKRQHELPVVAKKQKPKPMKIIYFSLEYSGSWALLQRDESSVWANLYELPNAEVASLEIDPIGVLQEKWGLQFGENELVLKGFRDFKHLLSHRSIQARCWRISISSLAQAPPSWQWYKPSEVGVLPVHRLMEKMLDYSEVWK